LTRARPGRIIAGFRSSSDPGVEMPLTSLRELYVEGLRDLYSAEAQLLKAVPRLAKGAAAPELRTAFERHALLTEKQGERLGLIFGGLGEKPGGKKCKAMAGLIAEAKDILAADAHPAVLDLALIAAAQRIEHYEIVGYEAVRTYARRLGFKEATALLAQTLEEEEEAEERLTLLAGAVILFEAEAASPADVRPGKAKTSKKAVAAGKKKVTRKGG
jgi:ferritin-like metal-binding protein YciE